MMVALGDGNDLSDIVQSSGGEDGLRRKWIITRLPNERYAIMNHQYRSIVASIHRPKDGDVIFSRNDSSHHVWAIDHDPGLNELRRYAIRTTDGSNLYWRSRDEQLRTPIELGISPTDKRNLWIIEPQPSELQTVAPMLNVHSSLQPALDLLYFMRAQPNDIEVNKHVCQYLVSRTQQVFHLVNESYLHAEKSPSQEQLDDLVSGLYQVQTFLAYMTRSNFLGSLLHAVEITERAKEALRLLDMRATTFKIAVRPSGNDFRKATEQDEDVLEQLLRKVTHGDIQNREASVLQAFGLRSFNQRQAKEITLAIQRYTEAHENDHSLEGKLLAASIRVFEAKFNPRGNNKSLKPPKWAISEFEIVVSDIIGAGGFSTVKKAVWDGEIVAVKYLTHETSPKELQKEIRIWKDLRHPRVLQFIGASLNAQVPFIVSAFMQNGNILDYLGRFHDDFKKIRLLHDVTLGMIYLHRQSVLHGDLKPANILIDDAGRARIADFGLSRLIESSSSTVSKRSNVTHSNDTIKGTLRFMAPEYLRGKPLTKASDVYSFAMTVYQVFTGKYPFYSYIDAVFVSEICRKNITLEYGERGLTDDIRDIIHKCSNFTWEARPDFKEVEESFQRLLPTSEDSLSSFDEGIDIYGDDETMFYDARTGSTSTTSREVKSPQNNGVESWRSLDRLVPRAGKPFVDFDYTPKWKRVEWGAPGQFYLDEVTFPKVLKDKRYKYRVVSGSTDLGIREPYDVQADGSQRINFLEYNQGYGIRDTNTVTVYLVDPETATEYKLTQSQ